MVNNHNPLSREVTETVTSLFDKIKKSFLQDLPIMVDVDAHYKNDCNGFDDDTIKTIINNVVYNFCKYDLDNHIHEAIRTFTPRDWMIELDRVIPMSEVSDNNISNYLYRRLIEKIKYSFESARKRKEWF